MLATRYWVALACAGLALTCAQAQRRPFTVKDDIDMTRISDPHVEASEPGSELVWPSPDGRWAAVVTSRGRFDTDKIESQILAFDLRDVATFLRLNSPKTGVLPKIVATVHGDPYRLESGDYGPVIKDMRWSADSRQVYFRAMGAEGKYRLCSANLDGSGTHWLTPSDRDVTQFDVVGTSIIFTATDPGLHLIDPGQSINRDAIDITGARIQDVLFPNDIAANAAGLFRLYRRTLKEAKGKIRQTPSYALKDVPYLSSSYPFSASPDGHYLIKLEPATSIPASWESYVPASGIEFFRLKSQSDPRLLRADNVGRPLQYTWIDLVNGRQIPLLPSPNARSLGYYHDANRAVWSPDGQRILVTNTFLPFTNAVSPGERTLPCAAATIDLPERNANCLYFEAASPEREQMSIQDAGFQGDRDHIVLLLRDGEGEQITRMFNLSNGKWIAGPPKPLLRLIRSVRDLASDRLKDSRVPTLFIHQSLNERPTIWAKEYGGIAREVWDPNPQFDRLQFGEASRYDWKDKDGRTWQGILVKPVGYVPGKRYPLVLQLYTFPEGQFVTDGLHPTAFAARELASAGIAVLQMRKLPNRISGDDPLIHLEAYRSAIRHLAEDGIADPAKVGVVGFSWTCWEAEEALVADPHLFAAATIADGLDNNYMEYKLFTVGFYSIQQQMDQIRGGPPFGKNLQHWVDVAPGFHLDRVQTPLRLEAINHSSVLQEWELYSSLQLLHKPVDFIFFPEGTHIHQKPLERLESQQGSVDWFRFWLKDEEDPDPSKQAQYQRWRPMRAAQAAQVDLPATPAAH